MKKSLVFLPALFLALFLGENAAAQGGWDAHLTKLTSEKQFIFAAIYGPDGVQWIPNVPNQPTQAETNYLFAGFANPSALHAKGPALSGTNYMVTRAEHDLIIGKKASFGFVAIKTAKTTYVLVTFNEATITPANANIKVQNFGAYLKSLGH